MSGMLQGTRLMAALSTRGPAPAEKSLLASIHVHRVSNVLSERPGKPSDGCLACCISTCDSCRETKPRRRRIVAHGCPQRSKSRQQTYNRDSMQQGHPKRRSLLSSLDRKHKVHVRLGAEDQFTDARLGVRRPKPGAIIAKPG